MMRSSLALAVVLGAAGLYVAGRRAGRLAVAAGERAWRRV